MPPFIYRCPNTGFRVQGFTSDDDESERADDVFVGVTCLACGSMHFVFEGSFESFAHRRNHLGFEHSGLYEWTNWHSDRLPPKMIASRRLCRAQVNLH